MVDVIALLSVAAIVNTTSVDCEVVDNVIVSLVALVDELLITGSWSSVLLIVIVILSVTLLPAASATVSVRLSVLEPKL